MSCMCGWVGAWDVNTESGNDRGTEEHHSTWRPREVNVLGLWKADKGKTRLI